MTVAVATSADGRIRSNSFFSAPLAAADPEIAKVAKVLTAEAELVEQAAGEMEKMK